MFNESLVLVNLLIIQYQERVHTLDFILLVLLPFLLFTAFFRVFVARFDRIAGATFGLDQKLRNGFGSGIR